MSMHLSDTPSVTADVFRTRKRELVKFYSDVVKIHLLTQFEERGYSITTNSLEVHTKNIMLNVVRQVSVEGESWSAVGASAEVEKIVNGYFSNLLRDIRSQSLERIILQIRSNDKDFEEGYQIVFDSLYKYIRNLVQRELGSVGLEIIEELISAVLLAIWSNIDLWDQDKGRFISWVRGITHHKVVDYKHHQIKFENRFEGGEHLESQTTDNDIFLDISARDRQRRLLEALLQYNDLDRTIFLYKINFDISFKELAQILQSAGHDLSPKAVEYKYFRIRTKLQHVIDEDFEVKDTAV